MNANASESIEPPLKGEVGGEAARRGSLVKSFYDVFNISGDPSVSAAHCQLPFQGSLIFLKRFVI